MCFDSDTHIAVSVTIRTSKGNARYELFVPKKNVSSEKHCFSVIGAGIEMACALLDAVYKKNEIIHE
jgi:hypothetical protein